MPLIANQPNYLTPVYNPVQYNLTTGVDNAANPKQNRFVLNIYFSSTTSESKLVAGDFIDLGGNRIEWVNSNPNTNQIPTGETSLQNQVRWVEQILDSNLIFESYDIEYFAVTNTNPRIYRLQLTSTETYPPLETLITWTSSTTDKIWFQSVYPEYNTFGNLRDNYALEFKLFYDWLKYPFNVSATVTGNTWLSTTATSKNFLASFYKIYQPINEHWFNLAETLQTVSSTDKYTLANFSSTSIDNIFQYDLNSLHNYGIQTYDLYSSQYNDFGIRRYGSAVNENKWFWNASKLFDSKFQFDTTPYYEQKYKFTGLTSAYTFQSIDVVFDYTPNFGDTFFVSSGFLGDYYYVCSSFTDNTLYPDIRYFALEQTLSGTAKNFKDMLSGDFDVSDFQYTQTNYGYSRVILNVSGKSASSDILTIDTIVSTSGKITTIEKQIASLDYKLQASGTTNLIKFLTDRPRTGTALYFPYRAGNLLRARPFTLSIFIAPSYPLPAAILNYDTWYGFRTYTKLFSVNGSNIDEGYKIYTDFCSSDIEYLDYYNPYYKKNGLYHVNAIPMANIGTNISDLADKMKFNIQHNIRNTKYDTEDEYVFPYSEDFEFDIIELCEYETLKQFVFLNGLGGWDWVDFIEDLTTEYSKSQALINTRFDKRITKETSDEVVLQNFITRNYKVSRIVNSQEEYDWLYDLVKSAEVYYIDGVSYVPIIITGLDYIKIENTNQFKLTMEYRIAQSDISQKSV